MTLDEARRIATLLRKMRETAHNDEAAAVMAQLGRIAARERRAPDALIAEAETLIAAGGPSALPATAPRPDQRRAPAPQPRRGVRLSARAAAARWALIRERPAWQDILILALFVALVYGLMILGGSQRGADPVGTDGEALPAAERFS